MAQRQEAWAHERSSFRGDAGRGQVYWSERIFRDQETLKQHSVVGEIALPDGLRPILEATDDGKALILKARKGAPQLALARAIHDRHATVTSIFLRVDARLRSALACGRELVQRFRELALDASVESSRPGIVNSTVFVEHAELLDEAALYDFLRLADLRRENRAAPRLILGIDGEVPGQAADLKRLDVPALEMRPGDVIQLTRAFFADRVQAPELGESAFEALKVHAWTNGEAQLEACLEKLMTEHPGRTIGAEEVRQVLEPKDGVLRPDQSLADIEEQQIYRVLTANEWNRTRSAQILGIDVKTLYNKLKRYESRKRRLERARQES